ncbi:Phosphate-import protein PhnD precursor [Pelagimonas phthalicica]|uniref:Phosphate-import protein PhnD n=1 Tax=Pelagimonas phthalicica TaxID=1037362 RepID=A0A238JCU4_9RHOB|nr:phosphonate ABC transporter substrate-binding protein [Pelagimonas phthalicica]TDS93820.1 phosphonate transport system substrate-binding protein [Pelagimonas phthalicica]SMX27656.1 Phosphate-import protein PhnD precursor [Pelagimonas phthalicica]
MKLLATTALVALTASAAVAADWKEDYAVIKFGILSGENEKDRIARYTPFELYLEKELGVEVEIFTAGNYDGVIQAIGADQIEFAFFGSSSYAAAYTGTDGKVEPLVSRQRKDGSTGYYSVVVTRCADGYKDIKDLEGKVLAFADPDSTSGYAVPYFNIAKEVDPKTFFSAIPFSGSHEAGVAGVVQGTFDAAATWQNNAVDGRWQRMIDKGMIEEGVVCPIWESPEITSGPFTARANLPQELKDAVKEAVMTVQDKDLEAFRAMTGWKEEDPNPQTGWIEVNHERYQWIVDMRAWLKRQRRSS